MKWLLDYLTDLEMGHDGDGDDVKDGRNGSDDIGATVDAVCACDVDHKLRGGRKLFFELHWRRYVLLQTCIDVALHPYSPRSSSNSQEVSVSHTPSNSLPSILSTAQLTTQSSESRGYGNGDSPSSPTTTTVVSMEEQRRQLISHAYLNLPKQKFREMSTCASSALLDGMRDFLASIKPMHAASHVQSVQVGQIADPPNLVELSDTARGFLADYHGDLQLVVAEKGEAPHGHGSMSTVMTGDNIAHVSGSTVGSRISRGIRSMQKRKLATPVADSVSTPDNTINSGKLPGGCTTGTPTTTTVHTVVVNSGKKRRARCIDLYANLSDFIEEVGSHTGVRIFSTEEYRMTMSPSGDSPDSGTTTTLQTGYVSHMSYTAQLVEYRGKLFALIRINGTLAYVLRAKKNIGCAWKTKRTGLPCGSSTTTATVQGIWYWHTGVVETLPNLNTPLTKVDLENRTGGSQRVLLENAIRSVQSGQGTIFVTCQKHMIPSSEFNSNPTLFPVFTDDPSAPLETTLRGCGLPTSLDELHVHMQRTVGEIPKSWSCLLRNHQKAHVQRTIQINNVCTWGVPSVEKCLSGIDVTTWRLLWSKRRPRSRKQKMPISRMGQMFCEYITSDLDATTSTENSSVCARVKGLATPSSDYLTITFLDVADSEHARLLDGLKSTNIRHEDVRSRRSLDLTTTVAVEGDVHHHNQKEEPRGEKAADLKSDHMLHAWACTELTLSSVCKVHGVDLHTIQEGIFATHRAIFGNECNREQPEPESTTVVGGRELCNLDPYIQVRALTDNQAEHMHLLRENISKLYQSDGTPDPGDVDIYTGGRSTTWCDTYFWQKLEQHFKTQLFLPLPLGFGWMNRIRRQLPDIDESDKFSKVGWARGVVDVRIFIGYLIEEAFHLCRTSSSSTLETDVVQVVRVLDSLISHDVPIRYAVVPSNSAQVATPVDASTTTGSEQQETINQVTRLFTCTSEGYVFPLEMYVWSLYCIPRKFRPWRTVSSRSSSHHSIPGKTQSDGSEIGGAAAAVGGDTRSSGPLEPLLLPCQLEPISDYLQRLDQQFFELDVPLTSNGSLKLMFKEPNARPRGRPKRKVCG